MTNVTDAAVVKALAHPVRVQILSVLEHRLASPSELADELNLPLANVSYHVTQLKRMKLIKLAKEARRRGAIEHYYRLEERPSISEAGWAAAPSIVKEALSQAVITQIGTEVEHAAANGAFERENIHLSRLPVAVDERGFEAIAREAERFVAKVRQIEDASAKRTAKRNSENGVNGRVVLMLFEAAAEESRSTTQPPSKSRSRKTKKPRLRPPAARPEKDRAGSGKA